MAAGRVILSSIGLPLFAAAGMIAPVLVQRWAGSRFALLLFKYKSRLSDLPIVSNSMPMQGAAAPACFLPVKDSKAGAAALLVAVPRV